MSTETTARPAFVPKIVKQVTLPVLKLIKNQTQYFRIIGPMHVGKKLDDQKEAATLAHAVDLVSGEMGQIVVPAVMQKELNENYPSESYVKRCFAVTLTRVADKRYNIVTLQEIEDPDAQAKAEAAKAEAAEEAAVAVPSKKK